MEPNYFHSVVLKPERCIGCTYCLKGCPTEAIRLRNGKASIIAERCIDCGECIRICPNHAKNAITDSLDIIKNYKYTAAITSPVLYSQFNTEIPPLRVLAALQAVGFDEACDTSIGSEIIDAILQPVIHKIPSKPVINSSCPAILRLIQARFPELLDNVLDIETPVEITARLLKQKIMEKTGLPSSEIGIILITPCTARVTSIKRPIGIDSSYIDGAVSIKDVIGPMLRILPSIKEKNDYTFMPTLRGVLWNAAGGQITMLHGDNTLAVDGINGAISILEEIEMGKLNNLSFVEITACRGGCVGGPLMIENKYVALNNLKIISRKMSDFKPTDQEIRSYIKMYSDSIIRYTQKIEPKNYTSLDTNITRSIGKMETMRNIIRSLPGINCGICGSPTCQAFAEDIVTGNREDTICPVNIMIKLKKDSTV